VRPDAVHHSWFAVVDDWAEGVALMHTNPRSGAPELHEYLGKAGPPMAKSTVASSPVPAALHGAKQVPGRTSTAQGIVYLKDGGQRFGQ
jgi:hypothetical protein